MRAGAADDAAILDYRVRWRGGEARPGKHPARQSGQGGDFRGWRPFWQVPDAQRIDIRRSITDPFGDVLVRQMEQRSAITLVLAADLSRSMQPAPGFTNLPAISAVAQAACRAAVRAGDSFGFLAFDRTVRDTLCRPPSRRRSAARDIAEALGRFVPHGSGADGVRDLAAHLPARRCLLLLASDFLMPPDLLDSALHALSRHDIAPILLNAAPSAPPRAGLLRVRDAETGGTRLLLMRPAVQRRWRQETAQRIDTLDRLFRRHGRPAFHATSPIDIGALSRHLSGL